MAKFFAFAKRTKIAAVMGLGDKRETRYLDPWIPGTAGYIRSTVEISISCRNLADKDILSKSDPMVVVFHRPPGSRDWVQMMRTEVVKDELNPDFVGKVVVDYHFERVQRLRFEVYDVDSATANLARQDNLGYFETSLGQILSAGEDGLTAELQTFNAPVLTASGMAANLEPPRIILIAEELAARKQEIAVKLAGHCMGTWSSCLPPRTYFSFSKLNDAGKYLLVYRSKMARGSNPYWQTMKISSLSLCNGDFDRELKIDVYQRSFSGAIIAIGSMITTVNKMCKVGQEKQPMLSPTGKVCNSAIRIFSCEISPINTFVDFLQSGTQIQTCFAIDFTCSNGDPEDQRSLHHHSKKSYQLNPYEQAVSAVGNILKDYDSSGVYPTYGFGARIPPKGDSSHAFPITLSHSPNCTSIPAVLDSYRTCLGQIMLYGPTNFAPVINLIAKKASKVKSGEKYYVLVIITDGVISDMELTKKAIVEASAYPMSIIIIGVGEADFDGMDELDGDAVMLTYKGKRAQRDIVQFVAYRSAQAWMANTGETTVAEVNFQQGNYCTACQNTDAQKPTDPLTGTTDAIVDSKSLKAGQEEGAKKHHMAQSQLAQELLAEIPEQITDYMKAKGIIPNMVKIEAKPAVVEEAVVHEV